MSTGYVLNLPEHGHVNATLPLVADLVARGERIVYFATEPYRAQVEATGAVFADYGEAARFVPPAHTGGLYSVMAYLMGLAEGVLPDVLRRLATDAPDYLLIDSMCVWGRLAQQVTGIPAVTLGSVFIPNDRHVTSDEMVRGAYGRAPREVTLAGIDALNTYLQISQRIDRRHGTSSPGIVEFFANRQPLNVSFTSKYFHLAGDSYDGSYVFVGPSMAARTGPPMEGLEPGGSDPLIYVSLGTIFSGQAAFFRTCVDAFADGPWRVLVSTGGKVSADELGAVPANVAVRAWVPQLDVLPQTSLCITHGGMNTSSEALWHGVPLLVYPQHGDQHLVAARVAELGAGLAIGPDQATPERLRAHATRMLAEPSFRRQAAVIAESFHAAGGARRAADAILSYVAGAVPAATR